jgi:hypothetical protein
MDRQAMTQTRKDVRGFLPETGAHPLPNEQGKNTPREVPSRVAMSFIRALANDWEEERERSASHPEHSNS